MKRAAVIAVAALSALALFSFYRFAERRWLYPLGYAEHVEKYAEAFGLESSLVYALIKTESGFDAGAESGKGAKGLMQLTDATAAFIASKFKVADYDVFDAETNVAFGCYYLWYLTKKFSHPATVLAAYNAGEGNVSLWLKDDRYSPDGVRFSLIPYKETENHVRKTLRFQEKYQKIYNL